MNIFLVTTMHFLDQKYGMSPRTVAWYPSLAMAKQCVLENWGDIYETSYRYVVIEELGSGLYPQAQAEHWFEWLGDLNGGYQPCKKTDRNRGRV